MPREQFTFYRSFWDAIREQSPKVQAELILAICAYALDDTEPKKLSANASMGFKLIRPVLDTGKRKAENRIRKNKAKTNEEQNENKTGTNEEQNGKEGEKEKEYEYEREREVECEVECECEQEYENEKESLIINNNYLKEKINKKENSQKRFIPPTVEQVQAYCDSRKNGINAQHFVDFYTSKGWMIGSNKMKDWQAAVRTWEKSNNNDKPTSAQVKTPKVPSATETEALRKALARMQSQEG